MTWHAHDDRVRARRLGPGGRCATWPDRYDFRYVVRASPGEMKKAGNLTNALDISTGDFIAVIDADFAVRPDFLYETMPYFADPPRSASSRPPSTTT